MHHEHPLDIAKPGLKLSVDGTKGTSLMTKRPRDVECVTSTSAMYKLQGKLLWILVLSRSTCCNQYSKLAPLYKQLCLIENKNH